MDIKILKENLTDFFSESEIDDLCFELNIDPELLPRKTKTEKIRELILFCRRKGLLPELIAKARSLRPNANWQHSLSQKAKLKNHASTRIVLDDWEQKAYRVDKLIDRLLLNQPFVDSDTVLMALEQYCIVSLKSGLPIEVWCDLSNEWYRVKTVNEVWVRLIVISALLKINRTKWLVKQTIDYLNGRFQNKNIRILAVWEYICKSYCFPESRNFNETILKQIIQAGIEIAVEKRSQNYSRLYVFFSFLFERFHNDKFIEYIANALEEHYNDIVVKGVSPSYSPSYLERLKRLIGKMRRRTDKTIHNLPEFNPTLIEITSKRLDYHFQAMKYPLKNREFVTITMRYPREENKNEEKEEINWEDPYVFFVDGESKNPFAELLSDAKSIYELCNHIEDDDDYAWDIPTVIEWLALADCEDNNFPWGNDLPTPEKANLDYGISTVSKLRPVGVYPKGGTQSGVQDCCGNVHEVVRLSRSIFEVEKVRLMGGCYRTGYREAQCKRVRGFARNQVLMRRNVGIRLIRYRKNDSNKRFNSILMEY